MGVKLEIVPTTLANRIPFLMTDKADIVISALSITPERAKVIDFSIPFAAIESVIAAPESVNIKSMADLAGKTIVTPRGTTNDANVTRLAPKDANIVRLETDATAMTAITSGRTNIYAGAPAIFHALNEKLVKQGDAPLVTKVVMATAMLGVGVKKGQPELVEKINGLIPRESQERQVERNLQEESRGRPARRGHGRSGMIRLQAGDTSIFHFLMGSQE
ncbi:transporter substrate-binding domain-containing protein [Castellaniella defragrans]|uniref:transporter substrate-binding domain-containing protein n=1 Tax=Castellaniella defragrans TaxID=75697 RepID=UPI002AFFB93D|nr:transporter substrate-binding domain-containing protein [Castellaniella defragrans]